MIDGHRPSRHGAAHGGEVSTGETERLVDDALDCLARECPAAYARLAEALGPRRVTFEIDGERFGLQLAALAAPVADVRSDRATIRRVIGGEGDALDEILAERLVVRAGPSDLAALAAAFDAFVRGLACCVSAEALLARLRSAGPAEPGVGGVHDLDPAALDGDAVRLDHADGSFMDAGIEQAAERPHRHVRRLDHVVHDDPGAEAG